MKKNQTQAERLPIKVILPNQGEIKPVKGGGSTKPFRSVTDQYRDSLSRQIIAIKENLSGPLKTSEVIPMKVNLYHLASAKSHRPDVLFSEETCPIIGAGKPNELFVRATSSGLDKLNKIVINNQNKDMVKALSTIDAIEPITSHYRLRGLKPEEILKKCPRRNGQFVAKARLFNFDSGSNQESIIKEFESRCKKINAIFTIKGYSTNSYVYEIGFSNVDQIRELSNFIGVRSISQMPLIKSIRQRSKNIKPLPLTLTRRDVSDNDIPVVVVVDSGISSKNKDLESWVVGRKSDVAPNYYNTYHGTFVAGLICWGGLLNPTVPGIDTNPCGVFDLQLLPNDDPSLGDVDRISEREFLVSLESALRQYSSNYKVWNLSLGTDIICLMDEFSSLAEELDNLQEKYQVSFVISSGNYDNVPYLDYPRKKHHIEEGRITTPADSVLGITVGSVAHVDYHHGKGPKIHQPSPFSRHGAGPNHIIKPDLVHYGGTCATDGSHYSGIRSVIENETGEDTGTSFSTPLVSRTLAQIYHQIIPRPNPVLARALLTHNACDPRRDGARIVDEEENYFGFGLPKTLPYCLECSPHSSTLVFEDVLRPRFFLEWDDFPYPTSLYKNGKYYGQISMTIAFSPTRGARWGSEYCEAHIDAHFGVYYNKKNRATGITKPTFKGLVPPEHKNPGLLYETLQVESLRKWSPVRTYYRDLGEKGERGNRWRLKLNLLTRHGISIKQGQPFSLIITISDPNKKAPVYDEMVKLIRNKYLSNNLELRAPIRIGA